MADDLLIPGSYPASFKYRTTEVLPGVHVPHYKKADDVVLTGPASLSAINTDLLSGTVNGWIDVSGVSFASVQIIASAGITAGAIVFEQTNDPVLAAAGQSVLFTEPSSVSQNPILGALNIAANTTRIFIVPTNAKYLRCRISTAFVGGTVRAVALLSQSTRPVQNVNVQQSLATNLKVEGVGPAAHDGAVSGNPLRIAGRALSALYTTVSTGDTADLVTTLAGSLITKPYAIPEVAWNGSVALTSTTAAALQAAAGAGLKRHLVSIQAINTGAAVVELIILDGTTERWRMALPVNVPLCFEFPSGLILTAATALNVNLSAVGTVRVNGQGYTAP